MGFMFTYAIGNVISGKAGDTLNPTTVLAFGLFGSGVCLFFIVVAIWFDFHGLNANLGNFFVLSVYFLFGFFQSTGGPVGTAVMGNWFCDKESVKRRGLIFGHWTSLLGGTYHPCRIKCSLGFPNFATDCRPCEYWHHYGGSPHPSRETCSQTCGARREGGGQWNHSDLLFCST